MVINNNNNNISTNTFGDLKPGDTFKFFRDYQNDINDIYIKTMDETAVKLQDGYVMLDVEEDARIVVVGLDVNVKKIG